MWQMLPFISVYFTHGGWSGWAASGACSATCGGGVVYRSRLCNNPAPVGQGAACSGAATSSITCNDNVCPSK